MKVECIKTKRSTKGLLTLGKKYEVFRQDGDYYEIVDDENTKCFFTKDLFELVIEDYNFINPNHYKQRDKETWEQMLEIWGKDAFIKHCEITAFKYIQRLGKKPNNSIEQDLEKARWYLNKAYDLKNND